MIAGQDAFATEHLSDTLFATTTGRAQAELNKSQQGLPHFGAGKRPQITAAIAGIWGRFGT